MRRHDPILNYSPDRTGSTGWYEFHTPREWPDCVGRVEEARPGERRGVRPACLLLSFPVCLVFSFPAYLLLSFPVCFLFSFPTGPLCLG